MIKWLLALSLAMNVLLVVKLLSRDALFPVPQENFVNQSSPPAPSDKKNSSGLPQKKHETLREHFRDLPQTVSLDESEYKAQMDKVRIERDLYLSEELGIDVLTIQQIEKLKKETQERISKVFQGDPGVVPSFEQRRQIISLEEAQEKKIIALMGKKNWDQFQSYRKKFNQEAIENAKRENLPVIPMDL